MKNAVPDQLRLLALIHRHGTLVAASQALGVTAAAVTQRLAAAESDWGAQLVARTTRGASLTPAGAVLAPFGEAVDQYAVAAESAFASFLGIAARRLRIGSVPAVAMQLLPPALTALRFQEPDADVSVMDIASEEAIDAVARGQFDLAVFASWSGAPPTRPGVRVTRLLDDPMVVVLPDDHPLAVSRAVDVRLAQLRDERWVLIHAGHAARAQFDEAARRKGFEPIVRFETASYDVAQALVSTGIGVALVSRLAFTPLSGNVAKALRQPALRRTIYAVTQADPALNALAARLVRLILEVAQERVATWTAEGGSRSAAAARAHDRPAVRIR